MNKVKYLYFDDCLNIVTNVQFKKKAKNSKIYTYNIEIYNKIN